MHLVIAYKYLHMNVSEPPTFDHPGRGCGGMAMETPRTGRRPTLKSHAKKDSISCQKTTYNNTKLTKYASQ